MFYLVKRDPCIVNKNNSLGFRSSFFWEVEKPELKDSNELRGEECLLRLSGDSVEEREEL